MNISLFANLALTFRVLLAGLWKPVFLFFFFNGKKNVPQQKDCFPQSRTNFSDFNDFDISIYTYVVLNYQINNKSDLKTELRTDRCASERRRCCRRRWTCFFFNAVADHAWNTWGGSAPLPPSRPSGVPFSQKEHGYRGAAGGTSGTGQWRGRGSPLWVS